MRLLKPFLIALCCSCGGKGQHPAPPTTNPDKLEQLKAKYALYLKMSPDNISSSGDFADTSCDGLLFSSLAVASGLRSSIDITRWESLEEPGRWFRDTTHRCFDERRSSSDVSKDMFTGLFYALWATKDLKNVRELIAFGERNRWIMGRGPLSRIYLTPTLRAILYELQYRLGGENNNNRLIPQLWLPVHGFERHLQVLSIILLAELEGHIREEGLHLLKQYAGEEPYNALIQAVFARYTDGNMDGAIAILLDEKYFPADRLPEPKDRCEPYLFQRDFKKGSEVNPDWLPCDKPGRWSGIDLIFTSAVILNKLGE